MKYTPLFLAIFALPLGALAQQSNETITTQEVISAHPTTTNMMEWDHLTGNWWGLRDTLADHGVDFEFNYFSEVWGNTTGGLKQGTVYTGLGTIASTVDFEKLVGWKGATFHNSWLWLSGRDASEDLTGNIFTVSNISGFNTFRMFEMWLEQKFLDEKASIRAGQLAADSEFVISDYGSNFINGTFGWPAFLYTNLPNGGPGFPMGTLGVRLELKPTDWLVYRGAVFQGDVGAQDINRHGFQWGLHSSQGFFSLHEVNFLWNQDKADRLPGTFKAGGWFDTGSFANSANADDLIWGNYGFYFILDQMIYREPSRPATSLSKGGKNVVACGKKQADEEISNQGLGFFSRFGFGPQDRNFMNFYLDTGLVYTGLIPTRDEDTIGIGFAFGRLSNGARNTLTNEGAFDAGYEAVLEFTYSAAITPWWTIQPDLQFIMHPGGSRSLNNALVIGARSVISF